MPNDAALLRAALVGYENQLDEIDRAIADLRRRLGGRAATGGPVKRGGKRRISEAARQRIAEAQKERWAAYRKNKRQVGR
ncbi:MAG TPA: hypothetical protein VGS58_05990 [Candidatus Sulfopaludibacter sp.]|nr:hypothetical protein [Candidatus Sulfopaludibacter sp.]